MFPLRNTLLRAALTAFALPLCISAAPADAASHAAPLRDTHLGRGTSTSVSTFAARSWAGHAGMRDSSGTQWSGRIGMIGPNKASSSLVKTGVAGTTEARLYGTTFAGIEGYTAKVPAAGKYKVRLLMTDDWFRSAGQRVFDVTAEGKTALTNIDIAGSVGFGAAYDRSFVTAVTDGQLDLSFVRRVDLPKISAIEVTYAGPLDAPAPTSDWGRVPVMPTPTPTRTPTPTPTPTTTPTPTPTPTDTAPAAGWAVRYTAQHRTVRDQAGNTWAPRPVGWGSWKGTAISASTDIKNTEDDALFREAAWGTRWFDQAVPHPGTYRVRLLMVEDYFTKPGQRVFGVRAEGATIADKVDIVAAAGRHTAHEIAFDVEVNDGRLNLDFPIIKDLGILSAIEITTAQPAAKPVTQHGRAMLLAPNSVWTQDISKAPVAPNSAAVVANLARTVNDRYGAVAAFNANEYNTAHNVVVPGLPRVKVGFHNCQNKRTIDSGVYSGEAHFVDVPVPADAVAAAGTDGQMSIYDPASDQLWEFWQMRRTASGWEACWGGRIDKVSQSNGFFPGWFGSSATGASTSAGMVTLDDVRHGEINHAMSLAVVDAQAWPNWSWPAQRTDGNVKDPNVIREGQRLRLDPSLNLDTIDMTPMARLVAEAAQKHGFIVTDRAGAVSVIGEAGTIEAKKTGVNPWTRLLGGESYEAMQGFPWHKLQALPVDYGKPTQ
ncbi:MAG: malectin domain-containing carbohydrate-binding protein [Dermatophilus congolensis]|nr:malectin domain-containing carbohydrate-binding protein [Dermatophilus congolensis]